MIISEKQIMQLINLVYEYRTYNVLKNEPTAHINQTLYEIENQQSEELKVIE